MVCPLSRREFLRVAGLTGAGLALGRSFRSGLDGAVGWAAGQETGWAAAAAILQRITPPIFPSRDLLITEFGAKGDGAFDCTSAITAAIAACATAGGGRVVVPAGRFVTGAIRLASRVNLHVADGATLAFSQDPAKYLPVVLTRFEGVEIMNYSPFIYVHGATDVAITGTGTLDGQADDSHWWNWKGGSTSSANATNQTPDRNRMLELAEKGAPVAERVFGAGHYLRPTFIEPYGCTNVLIDGVRIVNSPFWEVHPVLCRNVTVRGLTIVSHGPNNDGCDPESCRDVLIDNCTFDTGDDCIALKSGRNADGRRLHTPVENVIVRNCNMRDGHGGVTIGSEISGGARNIFVERCRMDSPRLDRAIRFKNNAMRGGLIERVYVRDVEVGEVSDAIVHADFTYEEGANGPFTPELRDVEIRSVRSRKSTYALYLKGLDRGPISDIRLVDCTFDGVGKPDVLEHVERLTYTNTRVNGAIRR